MQNTVDNIQRGNAYKIRIIPFVLFSILGFIFIFAPVSSVYGVDFSCPGGKWVWYSACERFQGYNMWGDFYYQEEYIYMISVLKNNYKFSWEKNCNDIPFLGASNNPYLPPCLVTEVPSSGFSANGFNPYPYVFQYYRPLVDFLSNPANHVCSEGEAPAPYSKSLTVINSILVLKWQCPAVCTDGQAISCYTGAGGTQGVGICKAGTQTCVNGQWGACTGEGLPATEVCGDNLDNNCDGQTDEGCNKDETTLGKDPCSAKIPPTNIPLGSSANPASGNLYHDQTLFQTTTSAFTLSYNSIDTYSGPLGKGWTHNWNLLLFSNPDNSIGLKQGDGNVIYFKNTNGIYYPEANSGDTSYITVNNDNTFTRMLKDGTTYSFNQQGKLTSIKDRNNNTTTLAYTGEALTTITDLSGRTTYLTYDSSNKITSITDPAGRAYRLTYTGDNLTSVADPDLNAWQYTYSQNSQMLTKTDPQGYITTYTYDTDGKVISSIDPEGKIKAISYQPSANTAQATEKDGGVWTYKYDPLLNVTIQKTDPLGNTTTYIYDTNKNLTSTKEPDGSTTSYAYDAYGNMASLTDPLGNTTTYTYNTSGQTTSITDSQNKVTTYAYDAKGNLISTTDPTGATTQYQYDTKGNIIQITNANNKTTGLTYDQFNNLISVTDSTGSTTTFTYDTSGNITSQTDPKGNITRFEYNKLNQLIKVTDPQNNITTNTYDKNSNKTSRTDANGKTTYYEYNYRNQITKVTDSLGGITTYTYGGAGCSSCGGGTDKLTAITDAKGQTTTYQYDLSGRLIKETDPLNNTITYSYDAKGSLVSKIDKNTINYTYDSLGRLTKKTYPDNTIEEYRYDTKGNIIYAGNQHITYNLTYDANNRLIAVTDSNGRTITYQYDAMGNRISMTTPEGKVISYSYDTNNRITQILSEAGKFQFTYDTLSRRTKLSIPNGTYTTYSYDTNSRLANLTHKTTKGTIIDSFTYTHDKVGNRLTKTEPDKKHTYSYDAIYRLTQSLPTKIKTKGKEQEHTYEHKAENYTYDPVGNRLIVPHHQDAYTYNQGNQLTDDRHNQYEYDKNGNLTKKTEWHDGKPKTHTYTYDYENRLIKVEIQKDNKLKTVTFTYDPFGRRLSKSVQSEEIDDDDNDDDRDYIRTTYYVYDNEDIIMEYNHKGKVTARYTHGLGIDEPLAIEQKNHTYYYHADGLGSIVALTDNRQKVVQTYDYDSFGGFKKHGNKVKDKYAFTGRIWDADIKLYDYRNRDYDYESGRFTTYDPSLHLRGSPEIPYLLPSLLTTPQELNPYVYTANNPINYVDPHGLFLQEIGKYAIGGGIMVYYYREMRNKNWKGDDPYYHCLASCKATKTVGADVSFNLGLFREASDLARGDQWSDSKNDLRSNMQGITCPPKQSCQDRCRPLAPKGMPIP